MIVGRQIGLVRAEIVPRETILMEQLVEVDQIATRCACGLVVQVDGQAGPIELFIVEAHKGHEHHFGNVVDDGELCPIGHGGRQKVFTKNASVEFPRKLNEINLKSWKTCGLNSLQERQQSENDVAERCFAVGDSCDRSDGNEWLDDLVQPRALSHLSEHHGRALRVANVGNGFCKKVNQSHCDFKNSIKPTIARCILDVIDERRYIVLAHIVERESPKGWIVRAQIDVLLAVLVASIVAQPNVVSIEEQLQAHVRVGCTGVQNELVRGKHKVSRRSNKASLNQNRLRTSCTSVRVDNTMQFDQIALRVDRVHLTAEATSLNEFTLEGEEC